jgi:hypothetical protein
MSMSAVVGLGLGLVFLASGPALAEAHYAKPGALGNAASAQVRLSIRIPALLRMRMVRAQRTVDVPGTGAPAPHVEVADAGTLEVQSNARAPCELKVRITDPDVVAVDVEGLEEPVTVSPEGLTVQLRPTPPGGDRTRRYDLRYRLTFAEGARPGPRPMPVAYTMSAGQ